MARPKPAQPKRRHRKTEWRLFHVHRCFATFTDPYEARKVRTAYRKHHGVKLDLVRYDSADVPLSPDELKRPMQHYAVIVKESGEVTRAGAVLSQLSDIRELAANQTVNGPNYRITSLRPTKTPVLVVEFDVAAASQDEAKAIAAAQFRKVCDTKKFKDLLEEHRKFASTPPPAAATESWQSPFVLI